MKGIKKMSFAAMAALAMVSCSNHDEWMSYEEFKAAQYDAAFVQKYGTIDPNHTWGFGSVATRAAANPWGKTADTHDWESKLNLPTEAQLIAAGAVQIDVDDNIKKDWQGNIEYDWQGKMSYVIPDGDVLYVSHEFNGELNLGGPLEKSCSIYNYGNITNLTLGSANADFTLYNVYPGTMVDNISPRVHEVYNTGTFIMNNNDVSAKVSTLYNGGTLELSGGSYTDGQGNLVYYSATINTNMTIYSTGAGFVNLPGGAVWNGACHIDGIVYTDGYLHIQNSDKYICGIVTTEKGKDKVEQGINILIDDDMTTSYIKTYKMCLNSGNVYLTKEGYVTADDIEFRGTGKTQEVDGSDYEAFKAEANSFALVEANKFEIPNGGQHFGNNVYSNYSGAANQYDSENPTIGGNSACGGEWGKKDGPGLVQGLTKGRIFCEDLGSTGDFDFNDVVFDAEIKNDRIYITLYAAGGILDVTVAGVDVHEKLGEGIVNTGVKAGDVESYSFDVPANGITAIEDIPVVVKKNVEAGYNDDILLKNRIGGAPQKICVPLNTKWVKEYEDISNAYPKFKDYVGNSSVGTEAFTEEVNEEYLY